jgi:hypothetical protein
MPHRDQPRASVPSLHCGTFTALHSESTAKYGAEYGLKKLIEHIWKVIGVASTCEDIREPKARWKNFTGRRRAFDLA